MRKDVFRKGMIFLIIVLFLLPNGVLSEGNFDEAEIIEDPFGDVYVFDYTSEDLENLTTTDEKPNIDIKEVTYAKNTGSTEVTLTIEVYGEIEDKGNLESGDVSSLNIVLYELSLSTSQDSYKLSYINQTCQLSYSNYTVVNITNFSIDGGNLTIQFDVLNASETYEEILANTFELVFSGWDFCGYFDYVPDPPMAVVIDGGPYEGGTGDDIEFSGVAYYGIPPYTYEWDFGDGETATGGTSVHSYEAAGNYAVTLTVTDDVGSTANATTTAMITEKDTIPPSIQFTSPERALYIGNKKVISFLTTIIVGSINIEVQASDYESGIDCVEFYIDNELKKTDNLAPYSWMWNEYTPFRFRHTIKAVAYDASGNSAVKEADVWKFFGGVFNVNDNSAPDFTLTDMSGINFTLSDYLGEVVLINFMATWCAPCSYQARELLDVYSKFSDEIIMISIDIDLRETIEQLRDFRDSFNASWIFALDTIEENVKDKYMISYLPTIVIIDREGNIFFRHHGIIEAEILINEIQKANGKIIYVDEDSTNGPWDGAFDSGDTVDASHVWDEKGDYNIKVKAKDVHGGESLWSDPLPIKMPKNKVINTPFIRYLENHPHIFPVLKYILAL